MSPKSNMTFSSSSSFALHPTLRPSMGCPLGYCGLGRWKKKGNLEETAAVLSFPFLPSHCLLSQQPSPLPLLFSIYPCWTSPRPRLFLSFSSASVS